MKHQRNGRPRFTLIAVLFSLLVGCVIALSSTRGPVLAHVGAETTEDLGQWTSHGPYGGRIFSLAIDPTNSAVVYAGSLNLFKSTNGGASWALSLSNFYTAVLAVDPKTPTRVYAAGWGVMKTENGGTSWDAVNNGLMGENGNPINIFSLVVDQNNTNIVYALGGLSDNYYNVYKSTNGGGNWSVVYTWFFQTPPNGFLRVNRLTIDPVNSNVLYAGGSIQASGVVFKSTNGGSSWAQSPFLGNDTRSIIRALAVDPVNPNNVYAASDGLGVFKSTNAGQSWTVFNVSSGSAINTIAIDPLNSTVIYVATYEGVFKSSDGGHTWNRLTALPDRIYFNALAIDPVNAGIVFTGTANGVFKTTNGGGNWSATNNGLHNANVIGVTVDPANAKNLYAKTDTFTGIENYASSDNGLNWSPVSFHPLAFDPHNSNIIYGIIGDIYDLEKSTDGGVTWSLANKGLEGAGVLEVLVDSNNSNLLYAGTYSGVFKSTDAGANWSVLSTQFYPLALVRDPKNSQILYAFTLYDDCFSQTYLTFKSTDGGITWTNGPEFYFISSLAVDPVNTTTIYLGGCRADDCGVFRSDDGAATWNRVSAGFLDAGVSSLVIDPTNPNLLYAGTFDDGVFKSADKGANWIPLNNGLSNFFVNTLAIDSTGTFLHAGTRAGDFDTQLSLVCAYSTSSAGQTFPAAGGSGSLNVTATGGCNWQATNNPAWITINSPSSGTGDGTVSFSVAANASPFPRTATLNVAGYTFTVNQFGSPPINTIDGTDVFVQQHYLDFLNRQPDTAGFAYWNDNINSCGFDPHCIDIKRIDTSAAFFFSIEFQHTGYLVERTYKTAYGDASGASMLNGVRQLAVPIVRLNEFLSDTQQIGQGLVVGQTGWQQVLEDNKQTFFSIFVQRPRFTSTYPASLAPAAFVDLLFTHAGVTPSASERNVAIAEFGSAADTSDVSARARALRRVAENATLEKEEFNKAFVLMQYFGYLRRNPNDTPDSDYTGYDFWLTKLNQFNGNYLTAEMVKAFLSSIEYRQRFGPP